MNLDDIRNWVKRIAGANGSSAGKPSHRTPEQKRGDRASSVIELQKEVRALQQQITDLENGTTPIESTAHNARLASLQSQLAQKQTALAKFQARI